MEWDTFGQGEEVKDNLLMKKTYIYFFIGIIFLMIVFNLSLYFISKSILILFLSLIFCTLILVIILVLLKVIRKKILAFFERLDNSFDNIINKTNSFNLEEETLISKFNFKLKRLYEIIDNNRKDIKDEKEAIQEVISDISHQIKTPITNLQIYNSTLLEREIPLEKRKEFYSIMETQINKLDFLVDSMIKVSRLEAGLINLEVSNKLIYNTLAEALSSIMLKAEKKNIEIFIECNSLITASHDKKWTVEALVNILDNAVKYSSKGGKILINVEEWESLIKIDIEDNGVGIKEKEFAQIFKRFYRGENIRETEGVGIGLYLCREIISKQNGYIKVKSQIKKGSTFSVFLPKNRVITK